MVRKEAAVILALVLTACGSSAPSGQATASGTAPASLDPLAPVASDPADLESLESLESLVIAETEIEAGWPLQWTAVSNGSLWLPNFEGQPPTVGRLDTETLELQATIDLKGKKDQFPPDATGIAASRRGIWVTLAAQDAVGLIDPATNELIRRIRVHANPYGLAVQGRDLWIADLEDNQVLRIDSVTGEELGRIAMISPYEIAATRDAVWVSKYDVGNIARIDPATNAVADTIEVGGTPGVTIGLGSVWARARDSKLITRIDPATNQVLAVIPMPSSVYDVEIAGGSVWAAVGPLRGECDDNSYVLRIDPTTHQIDGWLKVPCAFGLATDGHRLWANQTAGGILTINAE
jgi:DNA-binding beta-propeller fold protein YncE